MNYKLTRILMIPVIFVGAISTVKADELDRPFAVQNQNPFINLFGLARLVDPELLDAGEWQVEFGYSVASHFEVGDSVTEQIVIDGETERLDIQVRYGLSEGWEIGMDVPYVRHSGGYLDSLIIDWHDWFDFPQNGRDLTDNNQIRIGYVGPAGTVSVLDDVSGVGDVQIYLGRAVGEGTTLRAHLKLPTGDEEKLLGSGGVDAGVSLTHERSISEGLLWGVTGALTYLSEGDVLADNVRPVVAQFGARIAYQAKPWLNLKMQWDVHSQVYEDTRLQQLNEIAYILSFGGTIKLSENSVLDLVVTENYPHPEITPDVAFVLNYRRTLGS